MIQTRLLGAEVVFADWDVIQERVGDLGVSEEGGTIETIYVHPTMGLRYILHLPRSGRFIEVWGNEILSRSSREPVPYKVPPSVPS